MGLGIKFTIDTTKLVKLIKKFPEALDKRLADAVGTQVTLAMRRLIARGISPIEGHGKFPPYKASLKGGMVKSAKSEDKFLKTSIKQSITSRRQALKSMRSRLSGTKGKDQRKALREKIKQESLKLKLFIKQGGREKSKSESALTALKNRKYYPDSVAADFPNKKRRPVNLYLSGDFLDNLGEIKKDRKLGKNFNVSMGFKGKFADYELGHREQHNGQGFRPIIPAKEGDETFVVTIQKLYLDLIRQAIKNYRIKK